MYPYSNFYGFSSLLLADDAHTAKVKVALDAYQRAQIAGWLNKIAAVLRGRCPGLATLEKARAEGQVTGRRHLGLRSVPLAQICGSEGRSRDFDAGFNPLRGHTQQRWLNVMLARLTDVPLPPVELIQMGAAYYVRDGHHRISVARALGEECVEAEVTVWELAPAASAAAQVAAARA